MKNFSANIPLKEAIAIALQKLNSPESPPEFQRSTGKNSLNMVVSTVYFECKDSCYFENSGVVVGASLAVILANLLLQNRKFRWEPAYSNLMPINVCAHIAAGN